MQGIALRGFAFFTAAIAGNAAHKVVRLVDASDTCLGIAAIGGMTPEQTFPELLVADIGRALADAGATSS